MGWNADRWSWGLMNNLLSDSEEDESADETNEAVTDNDENVLSEHQEDDLLLTINEELELEEVQAANVLIESQNNEEEEE